MLTEKFWSHVSVDNNGCWLWNGSLNNKGYGQYRHDGKTQSTHRLAWMDLRGDIPDGLQLDHLCRVRRCINVYRDLEPVTRLVNARRGAPATKTECVRGHHLDQANTIIRFRSNGSTYRNCRTCKLDSLARYRASRIA